MKKIFHIRNIYIITLIFFIIIFWVGCKKEGHSQKDEIIDHSGHSQKDDHSSKEDHKDHDDHSSKEDHKDHDDHSSEEDHKIKNFGKNMAVLNADENKGIQLSKEAIKTIALVEKKLSRYSLKKKNTYRIPINSLIFYENNVGIYLKRDKWYTFHEIRIVKRDNKNAHIVLTGKYDKAMLIIEGCALLRLAHLEAFGASGDGHGH